jgi:hypothetical protein
MQRVPGERRVFYARRKSDTPENAARRPTCPAEPGGLAENQLVKDVEHFLGVSVASFTVVAATEADDFEIAQPLPVKLMSLITSPSSSMNSV